MEIRCPYISYQILTKMDFQKARNDCVYFVLQGKIYKKITSQFPQSMLRHYKDHSDVIFGGISNDHL
jgi:DNA-directed RNA polymerase subunit RPC12/RpoP